MPTRSVSWKAVSKSANSTTIAIPANRRAIANASTAAVPSSRFETTTTGTTRSGSVSRRTSPSIPAAR